MSSAVIRSASPDDPHLALANSYAQALIERLSGGGVQVLDFPETPERWQALRDALSRERCKGNVVAFYTYGGINLPRYKPCGGCDEAAPGERVCSCVIANKPTPCLTLNSAHLLDHVRVFGATACHLGVLFGRACVRHGALCFVGYEHDYWHCRVEMPEDTRSPFEDVATEGAILMTLDMRPSDVRQHMYDRYQGWLDKKWSSTGKPNDWWIVRLCLRHNADYLVAFP